MCGIAVAVGKYNKELAINLRYLSMVCSTRGEDSTGISFSGNGLSKILKDSVKATEFQKQVDFNLQKKERNISCLVHARKSSVGVVNKTNAHPFGYNPNENGLFEFSFAKNGTIYNWKELLQKYNKVKTDKVFTVDSDALGHLLFYNPDSIENILSEYVGGCAFVAQHKNCTYIFRGMSPEYTNGAMVEERPLFWSKQKNAIYVASEEWMLSTLYLDNVESVPENTLIKIDNITLECTVVKNINRTNSKQKESYYSYYPKSVGGWVGSSWEYGDNVYASGGAQGKKGVEKEGKNREKKLEEGRKLIKHTKVCNLIITNNLSEQLKYINNINLD